MEKWSCGYGLRRGTLIFSVFEWCVTCAGCFRRVKGEFPGGTFFLLLHQRKAKHSREVKTNEEVIMEREIHRREFLEASAATGAIPAAGNANTENRGNDEEK
jgi:hypothetical protein